MYTYLQPSNIAEVDYTTAGTLSHLPNIRISQTQNFGTAEKTQNSALDSAHIT